MQMLNALNERLSQSITKGRTQEELKIALSSLKIADQMIDKMVQYPIAVPLRLLMRTLKHLKLEGEIFEICCFPCTHWRREQGLPQQ